MNGILQRRPTLRELQRWLAASVFDAAHTPADIDSLIVAPEQGAALERLGVYGGGYPARIAEALNEGFPAVAHMLGAAAFHDLVQRYSAAVPLRAYNLNDAGAELPRFLGADPATAGLPFLPDLAALEWRVARAFHAFDAAVLDPRTLADWTAEQWERAVFRFQPWVALLTSDWPIREIWDCRETPIAEIDIDLNDRPDHVLVRRVGDAVVCESLDDSEAAALAALMEGGTLGSVVARHAARGDHPATVSAWFARWMALRMVTACERRSDATRQRGRDLTGGSPGR